MSPREKNLLLFFAGAGFIVLNFIGFNYAVSLRQSVDQKKTLALQNLDRAEKLVASSDQISEEMQWLAAHEPEPAANQDVQTRLQQFAEREAKNVALIIKTQKPLSTDVTEGNFYHRAKIQITLTGSEEALYRWFDRINDPEQLRSATNIRLSPNTQDDTQIDCTATVDQWFIPPA